MKKVLSVFTVLAVVIISSCSKDQDYNIRDINAGHAIGKWAYDVVYDEFNRNGLDVSKIKALQDDYIEFRPGPRDGLIATGTGTISQGNDLYWQDKAKNIEFTWRMDENSLNTIIIEVKDAEGELIGGNIANIDGSNFKLKITSSFRIVNVNGKPVKEFYNTSYHCHQLPL